MSRGVPDLLFVTFCKLFVSEQAPEARCSTGTFQSIGSLKPIAAVFVFDRDRKIHDNSNDEHHNGSTASTQVGPTAEAVGRLICDQLSRPCRNGSKRAGGPRDAVSLGGGLYRDVRLGRRIRGHLLPWGPFSIVALPGNKDAVEASLRRYPREGMMDSGSLINSTTASNGRYTLTDATPERTIPYSYSYGWHS